VEVFANVGIRVAIAVPVGLGSAVAVMGSVGFCKTAVAVSAGCAGLQEQRRSNTSTKHFI
jgi:hypothetical protein